METRAAVAPSEEERQVRELAHEFAAGELRPHVEVWDRERAIPAAVVGQLAELGFLGMAIPEEHGGMGFDAATFAAAVEELAWGEASVAMLVVRHAAAADLILRLGTEEQRARWLPAMARGETLAALAHWDTDDDAPATLEREGDALVLRGELARVTRARSTGLIVARAQVPGGGAGAVLVPADAPGVRVRESHTPLGLRPLEVVTAALEDVRLGPEAELAGAGVDPGAGDIGRLGAAAVAAGVARAALEHAAGYADVRQQFRRRIREFEGMQFKLADMAIRTTAAATLVRQAAAVPGARASATAKVAASEAAMWVATQAVQVFGGYGYMRDYPVEKLMRDAKATEILGGLNQALRRLIARELYRA
ncbi:MAG: acyl-CoA dehydrogenase family protein [bacterium]|nr:MAG: acyl-CoA dehydrogenase [bacterium]